MKAVPGSECLELLGAFQVLQLPAFAIDVAGVVVLFNESVSRALGFDPASVVGAHLHDFLTPDPSATVPAPGCTAVSCSRGDDRSFATAAGVVPAPGDPGLRLVVARNAPSPCPGEPDAAAGGEEPVANTLWRHSRRSASPFIPLNCATFSEGLIESELFGHERGAFTSAVAFPEMPGAGSLEQIERGHILRVLRRCSLSPFARTSAGRRRCSSAASAATP